MLPKLIAAGLPQQHCSTARRALAGRGSTSTSVSRPRCASSSSSSMATPAAEQQQQQQLLQGHIPGFRQRVAEVNSGLSAAAGLLPFHVAGQRVGSLTPEFSKQLLAFPEVFQLAQQQQQQQQVVTLVPALDSTEARTAAVSAVLTELRSKLPPLDAGWRDELYPVTPAFDAPPLLLLERAAAPYFGVRAYGVHVNGYVVGPDGAKRLWVARRSASKQTWPGKLDHIVAGGQPYGLSPSQNVAKECYEEAGIPASLAAAAQPVGFVSYVSLAAEGLKPDVLFCYDLALPADFVPQPQDGEVESFELWDLARVASTISGSTDYKPNCCLVIIDFLARHGALDPAEPGYLSLLASLRAGDPA